MALSSVWMALSSWMPWGCDSISNVSNRTCALQNMAVGGEVGSGNLRGAQHFCLYPAEHSSERIQIHVHLQSVASIHNNNLYHKYCKSVFRYWLDETNRSMAFGLLEPDSRKNTTENFCGTLNVIFQLSKSRRWRRQQGRAKNSPSAIWPQPWTIKPKDRISRSVSTLIVKNHLIAFPQRSARQIIWYLWHKVVPRCPMGVALLMCLILDSISGSISGAMVQWIPSTMEQWRIQLGFQANSGCALNSFHLFFVVSFSLSRPPSPPLNSKGTVVLLRVTDSL